jgi:hypothetical protein
MTAKQTKFLTPGGGWIMLEQDGEHLTTVVEGRNAAFLARHILSKEMNLKQAVAYCKTCLQGEKENLQDFVTQQLDFVGFCEARIELANNDLDIRNPYEEMRDTAKYAIRLAERRLKKISK